MNFFRHDSTWACYLASALLFYTFRYALGLVWRILAEQGQILQKHIYLYVLHSTILENLIFFKIFSFDLKKALSMVLYKEKLIDSHLQKFATIFFILDHESWTVCDTTVSILVAEKFGVQTQAVKYLFGFFQELLIL